MAYVAGEILVNVEGNTGASERWSNTWAFNSVDLADEADVISALHDFYQDLATNAGFADDWTASNVTLRRLASGVSEVPAWESIAGTSGEIILPTQLGIRVSINDAQGTNGGPFICGWDVLSVGTTGILLAGRKATLAGAVEQLDTDVQATGAFIGLHRPTVSSVATATRARIGSRFDVMRSRGNDTAEGYTTVNLG